MYSSKDEFEISNFDFKFIIFFKWLLLEATEETIEAEKAANEKQTTFASEATATVPHVNFVTSKATEYPD